MIIILPDSEKASDNSSLTVNIHTYDSFLIRKMDDAQFQLTLTKCFDGHFSSQSNIWYVLFSFESYEKCYDLFEAIIGSLENGDKVFRVRNYLEQNALNALQRDDLPKV